MLYDSVSCVILLFSHTGFVAPSVGTLIQTDIWRNIRWMAMESAMNDDVICLLSKVPINLPKDCTYEPFD